MKKIIYTTIIFTLALVSCNDDLENVIPQEKNNITTVSHAIPVEDALDNLQNFLDNLEKNTVTRADFDTPKRRIGTVDVIRKRDAVTRGDVSEDLDADSLLYVVNFEDNQGYALLAADDRISSPLIFVGDSGNVNMGDLGITFPVAAETRRIYPEFPTTGSGTFYAFNDSTNQEELFMNPNTFDLYGSTTNGYFVGNFCPNGEINSIDVIFDMTYNYIDEQLDPGNNNDDGNISDWDGVDLIVDEEAGPISTSITRNNNPTYGVVGLLRFAHEWHQGSPFNNECPKVSCFPLFWKTKKSAGCVPLSIAQIMTYFEYPHNYKVNNKYINWPAIKYDVSGSGADDVAFLIRAIGAGSGSIYFYPGTFTFPSLAARYMTQLGFRNVDYCGYEDNLVKRMLDNQCPVFICSIPSDGKRCRLENSHAWNLDGYMMNEVTTIKNYYQNGEIIETQTNVRNLFMVHCNFGWGSGSNGYFTSGVFDLSDEDVIFDKPSNVVNANFNYKWYIKMIYYDRP